jgi:hypothetical protein
MNNDGPEKLSMPSNSMLSLATLPQETVSNDGPEESIMPSNKKSLLSTLPREIFDLIISGIGSRTDISSLSRTSKLVRSLTIEFVFENVTMLWTGNNNEVLIERGDPNLDLYEALVA